MTKNKLLEYLKEHWKFILIGCSLIAFFQLTAFQLLFHNGDALKKTMQFLEEKKEIRERLGLPLKTGWHISGRLNSGTNGTSTALGFSISGPLSAAEVQSHILEAGEKWSGYIYVTFKDGSEIAYQINNNK